jgi:hypothetical protein
MNKTLKKLLMVSTIILIPMLVKKKKADQKIHPGK